METPIIKIGIVFSEKIGFELNGTFTENHTNSEIVGNWFAEIENDKLILKNSSQTKEFPNGIVFTPTEGTHSNFMLKNVVIGINFHWERKENQIFKGGLKLLIENGKISAINLLSVEDYLCSVISSEMSATSSTELLKAHAVISRSWLLAQIQKNEQLQSESEKYETHFENENELIRWYDREDHQNFDVCADDHCQRYQGITRSTTPIVEQAVNETCGEILMYNQSICDARFSKCCGGVSEIFENAWEPVNHPYLQKIIDNPHQPKGFDLNLENEEMATKWILGQPEAFCNTSDKKVLSQVLNDYDQETNDFYRWTVSYSQQEISELVKTRTGIDFGNIQELIPVERGTSARLIKLKIVGDKKTLTIGKELEIRKALSKSHLYSSAFIVEKKTLAGEISFTLKGAGWGHGVGLCQIGAAVMGDKGYSYHDILMHYFKGATLEKKY